VLLLLLLLLTTTRQQKHNPPAAESGPLIARKLDLHQQFSVSFTINLYPDGTPLEKPDFLAIWLCNFFLFVSRIVKLPGRHVKLLAALFLSIIF
jgi:hypothetical protein